MAPTELLNYYALIRCCLYVQKRQPLQKIFLIGKIHSYKDTILLKDLFFFYDRQTIISYDEEEAHDLTNLGIRNKFHEEEIK